MAFPWDKEEGFEDGTAGIFDGTETDTGARLSFASYRDLAAKGRRVAPWRGAYCMEIDLAKSTAEATIIDPDFNVAAAATAFFDFMLYVSPDIVMANNDEFVIARMLDGATDEGSVLINFTTAAGLRIGISEPTATAGDAVYTSLLSGWHHICVKAVIDNADSSGEIDLFLDDTLVLSLDDLDQGDPTDLKLGVIGQDAGTTAGFLLFDDFREDSAQLRPHAARFPENLVLTKSGHAFVGPGKLTLAQLIAGAGTDCVMTIFDTDRADVDDENGFVERVANVSNNETLASASNIAVTRGCYVQLAGTNPRALLRIASAVGYGSDGAILRYGARVV